MKSPLGSLISVLNKTPVPYVGRYATNQSFVQHQRNTSTTAEMASMGSVGTLFAIVNRTSNSVSQVDWKLWRKAASGKKEDRVEVTRHAALDLWNKPNPYTTRQEFVESFSQHLDLTGEAWWVVGRNENFRTLPLELWVVRPDRMTPVPHPTEFLAGYIFSGPDGEKVPLNKEDVVQLRMPNPLDPYRGMGPVQSILTQLDSIRYSKEWNRNFFLNSAEPGGIVEVPESLSDADFDQLSARWNEQHSGVANAHRVAFLEHGKWVDRKYTMRDMQFVELNSVYRDDVLGAFGFPKSMLGIVEDVNRANAETSKTMFAENLVVPRLERIKGALNNDLLPLFGTAAQGLEFDYDDPVPEDAEARNAERDSQVAAYVALINAGVNTEDAAAFCGLPIMRVEKAPQSVQPQQNAGM